MLSDDASPAGNLEREPIRECRGSELVVVNENEGVADRDRAVEAAYRAHAGAVWRTASRICGPDLASDVAQEVFLRLVRSPARFEPARASLRTYLLVLTRGVAIDLVRSDQRRRQRDLLAHSTTCSPCAAEQDSLERLLAEEAQRRLKRALGQLADGPRAAIESTYFGELTFAESSLRSGVPAGTIKSRVGSGLRQLRPILADLAAPDHHADLADPDDPDDPDDSADPAALADPAAPDPSGSSSPIGDDLATHGASHRSRRHRRDRLSAALAAGGCSEVA